MAHRLGTLQPVLVAAFLLASLAAASAGEMQRRPDAINIIRRPSQQLIEKSNQRLKLVTEVRLCFWRDLNGHTPFGKSGSCPAPSDAVVGDLCACPSPRPNEIFFGNIIAAPKGDGSSQVVR
jgi:hypothetical protein